MFKNMKIAKRLALSFSIIAILLVTIAVLSIVNLMTINDSVENLVNDKFPKTVWANIIVDNINLNARCNRNILLLDKVAQKEDIVKEFKRIADAREIIDKYSDSLKAKMLSETGKKLFAEFEAKKTEYRKDAGAMRKLMDEGKWDDAKEYLFKEVRVSQLGYMDITNKIIDYQTEQVNKVGSDTDSLVGNAETLIIVIGIIAILLAIFIAFWITKSITKPLNEAVNAADKISEGNFSVNLDTNSKDETGILIASMKKMKDTIADMVGDTKTLANAAIAGKLDVRANASKYQGEFNSLVSGVNETLDAVIGPLNVAAEYVDRISKGDIPPKITDQYNGDFNEIKNNLNGCIDAVNYLVNDAAMLSKAAVEGKLDTRADANKHNGKFRDIVAGVNATLDNVIGPLNVAAEYVDRISKGDIPPRITDNYNGDFNEIKNNLNQCIDAVNNLVTDAAMLSKAAVAGKLDTRADGSKHNGEFRAIVEGVNNTLDSVIGPLNVAAEYVDRISKGDIPPRITDQYNGDFNEIKNNLNQCIDAVNNLVTDAKMLAKAAKEGKLATRADASKHGGDFKAIVEGVNTTLDDVIGPLNVAADYVDKISKGDIPEKITKEYFGDFNIIKSNLNSLIDSLNDVSNIAIQISKGNLNNKITLRNPNDGLMIAMQEMTNEINKVKDEVQVLIKDSQDGKLNNRGDITKFDGVWKTLVLGINNMLDAILIPIGEGNRVLKLLRGGDLRETVNLDLKGDHKAMQDAVNGVQGWLKGLINYVTKIANGDMTANIDKASNDDQIHEWLILMRENIKALVVDANMLAKAAVEGNLSRRADATKHNGDFRAIVEGVNETINSLMDPVNEATEILGIMSTGDLTSRMQGDYNGDHMKLKDSINTVQDSLSTLLKQVNDAVQSAASAALEITSTAESLAASSEEQNAQADEVASAVEEMSRTVTENAMAANRTAEVAIKNGNIASDGGNVVGQTVTKMRDIAGVVKQSADNIEKLGESSKQIGEIISVIDDIADQTNLLALNAAIEAARAGEQGRGFAVVADEVRKLAERTTEATKQIAVMIKGIQSETQEAVIAMKKGNDEVSSGIALADRAGSSLKEIVVSTQDVIDMINQIAAASEQQSSTSEEISKNVSSISEVTGESTKRIQDIAHSSDDLSKLTEHLKNLIDQFKIGEDMSNYGGFQNKSLKKLQSQKKHLPPGTFH
jgi:methyl-accepting chemotaxis protein